MGDGNIRTSAAIVAAPRERVGWGRKDMWGRTAGKDLVSLQFRMNTLLGLFSRTHLLLHQCLQNNYFGRIEGS